MKSVLHAAVLLTIALAGTAPVHAATATANFNVTASLTSKCEITVAPADVAFTYTSFQAAAQPATGGGFTMRCTNQLPYTLSLNAPGGTVIGLAYTLTLSAAGGTGGGLTTASYNVNGSMVAGQSGTCNAATCTGSAAHVLTVTY